LLQPSQREERGFVSGTRGIFLTSWGLVM